MSDRREAVLVRLHGILDEVVAAGGGVALRSAVRDIGSLPPDARPAFVLLDADEVAREDQAWQRGLLRADPSPCLVDMTPEIYILMENRDPQDQTLGTGMNALRAQLVKTIMFDPTLALILGGNGRTRYSGCLTDMASGRSMMGEMHLRLTFTYVLRPSEL